jgi:hypothetical protein
MASISFEVKQQIGVLSNSTKGWSKQFNLVSWNGREAKYDIRDWDENLEKMGRGVSLSQSELSKLRDCLVEMDLVILDDEQVDSEAFAEMN